MPAGQGFGDVKSKLCEHTHCSEEPPQTLQCTFYDSFDWRIYDQGGALETEQDNNGEAALLWHSLYPSTRSGRT